MFAIGNMLPSPCDELIPPDQVHERHNHYIAVMTHDHSIKPLIAMAVTDFLSPSTGTPLRKFDAVELLEEFDDEEDEFDPDAINILRLFGSVPSEAGVDMVMPLASELSDSWYEVFDFLGWEVEPFFNDYEVAGSPSFLVEDCTGESPGFPVYLIHAMPVPSFNRQISEIPTIRLWQCACLGDFVTEWADQGSPGFLLLTAYPQITLLNGKYYCYVGQMYVQAEGHWIDLLLNKACVDVWTLLELNSKVTDGFRGASKLGERTELFGKRIALLLSGFEPEIEDSVDWSIVAMGTQEGWSVVRGVSNDDYDLDDLEPYMLTPLRKF
ncbi:hypothetical protein PkP19E3_35260 (plasmid) [Pseudomonas koreensis]|nr:hypothetical protein PkP19E3_35260 [Pseudomonas koreensis]